MRLTTEQVQELRERSKDDMAIIAGGEIRSLCDRIDELEAEIHFCNHCLQALSSGMSRLVTFQESRKA
jgi:hypothetical protein